MEVYLVYLTYIAVILLFGLLTALIAKKIKIPNVLILIITGILLGSIKYKQTITNSEGIVQQITTPLFNINPVFISSIGILALALIVFNGARNLKLKEFDTFSLRALKLVFFNLLLNLIGLTFAAYYILNLESIWIAFMFSAIITATASDVVLLIDNSKNRISELLKIESLINTPIVVLIPFIIIDLTEQTVKSNVFATLLEQVVPFLQQIIVGIGSGVLVGIIIFKVMKKSFSKEFSPIAIVVGTLLTYILSENLGGNGVLAVTVLGLFVGNIYLKDKDEVEEFSDHLSTFLEILVFVLVGLLIQIPLKVEFLINLAIITVIYFVLRFISTYSLKTKKDQYNFKERLFITLNSPKGIAVAVTALMLSTKLTNETGISLMLDYLLGMVLLSIIISTITIKMSKFFLAKDEDKK